MKTTEFEDLVDLVAGQLVQAIDALPEADVPFDARKLSSRQQMESYIQQRNDPEAFKTLIQQQGLGPVVRYAQRFEKRYRNMTDGMGEDTEVTDGTNSFGSEAL